MPDIHAFLSASTAHRWIPCPPSARLCEKIPEMKSSYTEEGSEAHALGEFKIKQHLKNHAQILECILNSIMRKWKNVQKSIPNL